MSPLGERRPEAKGKSSTVRPYLSLRPRARAGVLLTCEHATNRLPRGIAASRPEREILASHWGWDIGAWDLTRELSRRLGATAVGGRWSRLLIDLNRAVSEPTLVRQVAGGVALAWNRRLGPAEVERRVLTHHAPYHAEVERRIVSHLVRGARPLILAIHSFAPELSGERRRFEIGVLFGRHSRLARVLGRGLADTGLRVRYNEPYSGLRGMMYSAETHGTRHDLPCLELEVNQGLFEERTAAARLGRAIARVLSRTLRGPTPTVSGT